MLSNLGTYVVLKIRFCIHLTGQILHVFLLFPPTSCALRFSNTCMQKPELYESINWCTH